MQDLPYVRRGGAAVSNMAAAVAAGYKTWKRKPADLYPTPVDGTESLMPILSAVLPAGARIWEPACAGGRMSRVLEAHGFDVISTDLRDDPGYGQGGVDFLTGAVPEGVQAIVTNPPFSHAEQFIRRALTITPVVAMLLKQTYWNTKGRIPLWHDHTPDLELKLTWRLAFLEQERGKSPLMDCMWSVWTGSNTIGPDAAHCQTAPLPRRRYAGYAGTGVLPAVRILGGELDELSGALRGLL